MAHIDAAARCVRLQSGCGVDRIADRRVVHTVRRSDISHDRRSIVYADTKADRSAKLFFQLLLQRLRALDHVKRRFYRLVNAVLLRQRSAPECHGTIADKFVQRTAVVKNTRAGQRQIPV